MAGKIAPDDINAFVPGPRVHVDRTDGRPAVRPHLCRQGSVRCRRPPDRRRQSGLGEIQPDPDTAFLGGATAARCRRQLDRQNHHRRGLARHRRRERLLRHAGQCPGPGTGAGRLVLGLGRGGRRRGLRHRDRHRHRRLGAGAGELLRALRHPPDAWPASTCRACCRRRRARTRPAGSRATPRPLPACRASCSTRRSRRRCQTG